MNNGDIFLVEFQKSIGHEQSGFRPVIIMSDTVAGMVTVVPLTSNAESTRFPHTLTINAGPSNGLKVNSVALTFQITAVDQRRLMRKIGRMDGNMLKKVKKVLKDFLSL